MWWVVVREGGLKQGIMGRGTEVYATKNPVWRAFVTGTGREKDEA